MCRKRHRLEGGELKLQEPSAAGRKKFSVLAALGMVCVVLLFNGSSVLGQGADPGGVNSGWTAKRAAAECPLTFTAEWLTLYKEEPRPLWFFPFLLSETEEIGLISTDGDIWICETVERSTWTERSLWLRVVVKPKNQDELVEGWLTVGPVDLHGFLNGAAASRE